MKRCVALPSARCFLAVSLSFTFVRSQVNSDKIYWQRKIDGTFSQIYSEKKLVGHAISTKAVGTDERSDITHLYKHPEGDSRMV